MQIGWGGRGDCSVLAVISAAGLELPRVWPPGTLLLAQAGTRVCSSTQLAHGLCWASPKPLKHPRAPYPGFFPFNNPDNWIAVTK